MTIVPISIRLVSHQAILALAVFVAAAGTVGSGLLIQYGRQIAVERARTEINNYAFVLGEQTDRSLQSVEFVQKDIIERIRHAVEAGDQSFDDIGTSDPIFAVLVEKAQELPQVEGFALIRPDGISLATSQGRARYKPYDLSQREYFRNVMADPIIASKISPVVASRLSPKSTIMFTRKITTSSGKILGVINAALDITYFDTLFRTLIAGSRFETGLVLRDGRVLAQYPASGPQMVNEELRPFLNNSEVTATSAFTTGDGELRLGAIKGSSIFPTAIVVSDAYSSILANWRRQATATAVTALLMNIAIAIAWYLGRRHVRTSAMLATSESHLARHDSLTNIPNRLFFLEEMRRRIDAASTTDRSFALFVIDLNRFKEINDTLGHPTGDLMIQNIALRLQSSVGSEDFVGRIGGDEFALILHEVSELASLEAFASKLWQNLAEPHLIEKMILECKCSIGIAIGLKHGNSTAELLKAADLALYAVKAEPLIGYRIYDAELNAERLNRLDLVAALPQAIENDEFELHYQPIVSLKTNRCWGFECLTRWRRPGVGLVPPNEFIATLEEIGLITKLGRKILIDACVAASKWPTSLHVSVNVSPIQLASSEVVTHIREALEISKLKPSRLSIEVTESVMLGDGALERLRLIRKLGVTIALDDFGTGFASMSYLQIYPYQRIKIDRSFVENMSNPKSRAIVVATIGLARDLKIETTAEGVETPEQLEELRKAGASQAQGYLFARPMPEADITGFLQMNRPNRAA